MPGASRILRSRPGASANAAGGPSYAAAKAGVNNLTQTLALELAPAIRVNAVAPGPVMTESFREVITDDPERIAEIESTIPLGRTGTPDDIAAAVAYLASDAASWVTGQLLLVAGGRTHRTASYQRRRDV